MSQNIKQVKFEWKEIFKTDMEIAYRVICVITSEDGKIVEASEILKLHKALAVAITVENSPSASKIAESTAYRNAVSLLNAIN